MNRSERDCLNFLWFVTNRNKTVVIKVGNWLTDFGGTLATAGVIETARIVSKKVCSVLNHVHRDRDKPPLLRSSRILAFKKNTESNKDNVNPDVHNKCHKLKVLTSKRFISLKSSDFVWKHTYVHHQHGTDSWIHGYLQWLTNCVQVWAPFASAALKALDLILTTMNCIPWVCPTLLPLVL
jgi:hypothetical protein